jgi:hypothetical protein
VKINLIYALALTFLFNTVLPNIAYANNTLSNNKPNGKVSTYLLSESYSNILPIKQLVDDEWKQVPATDSSIGFTQNELGLKAYWGNISFNVAHRVDYFVFTNPDTAQAFYLERTNQPLTTQESYKLSLKLHHQRSNGFRLGYQWQLDNFSTEVNIGYWDVSATRESHITGEIFGEENNNITGTAELSEFYSDKNFLKRDNFDRWDIDGYGITVDFSAKWQVSSDLKIALDVKDLYSQFKMENLGYSEGNIDTEGTFINSLGGKSYLPLYRGRETADDYQFDLPEQVNLQAHYQTPHILPNDDITVGYLARFKRQGEVNFYYAGITFGTERGSFTAMLDLEQLSPELRYSNKWVDIIFATDKLDLDKAMQLTLGITMNYAF